METSVNRISDKTTAVTDSHIAVASVLTANGDKSQKFANPFFLNVPDKLSAKIKENDIYDCVLSADHVNVNVNMGDSEGLVCGIYHKNIPDKQLSSLKEYAEYSCIEFGDGIIFVDERYKKPTVRQVVLSYGEDVTIKNAHLDMSSKVTSAEKAGESLAALVT